MPVISQRPPVPLEMVDAKEHLRRLAQDTNASMKHDGTKPMTAPLKLASYTVATVPTASLYTDGLIAVSDETGGYTVAFSDGTNWRRVQDRAIVA